PSKAKQKSSPKNRSGFASASSLLLTKRFQAGSPERETVRGLARKGLRDALPAQPPVGGIATKGRTAMSFLIQPPRGPLQPRAADHWKNWGETASCQPEVALYPETVGDLVAIVRLARHNNKKIRVVGAGHSWAALVPTDHYLVFVSRMNRVRVDLS